ncbi:hypothetical protein Acor_37570 [Acrocarpospora corrugata]|uniref:Uncharacterized protein n=1 Tax=Acrocarpospora corrugata TaxID=35763 RepID=A0A5M3W313_9ACTN|nr:hypothetical protein [Acrocarpospora corrugata]GES01693.1 hypothetical protein Acor_37570 [Acrocarpospora corrugata]
MTRGARWSARWNGWRDARRGLPVADRDDWLRAGLDRLGYVRKLRCEAERVQWELLGQCAEARAAMVACAYRVLTAGPLPVVPAQGPVPPAVPMSQEVVKEARARKRADERAHEERRRRDHDREEFLRALTAWERVRDQQRAHAHTEIKRIEGQLGLYLATLVRAHKGRGRTEQAPAEAGALIEPLPEWSRNLPQHEADIVNRALALLSLSPLRPPEPRAETRVWNPRQSVPKGDDPS